MIAYVVSDLFQSPAQVLVNPVNTVAAMGKGVARDFRQFYPKMYDQYRSLCERGEFQIGQLWLYKTAHKWILNFPTKQHWRDPSKPEYIEAGLRKFAATYAEKGITSISFPMLGSGLGGLDWETQVRPLMERYLASLPINIFIHVYNADDPPKADPQVLQEWLHGEPQLPTFAQFWNDLTALLRREILFESPEDHSTFQVTFDAEERRVMLSAADQKPLILSESTLADLWHAIRTAGYCAPQNFPSGLDSRASMVVALLTRLDYIRPVKISRSDTPQGIGLQVVSGFDRGSRVSTLKVVEA
jgi:O-acetyl-ADP-ribose deacetylase (regulator of RNase III)